MKVHTLKQTCLPSAMRINLTAANNSKHETRINKTSLLWILQAITKIKFSSAKQPSSSQENLSEVIMEPPMGIHIM